MRFFDIVIIAFLLAANYFVWLWSDENNIEWITRENGPLENTQMVVLSLAMLAFFYRAIRSRDAVKTGAIALTALCFAMLFRELGRLGGIAPEWFLWTMFAPQRDILFISALLLIIGYVYLQRRHLDAWMQLLARPSARLLFTCGALLSVSFVLDITFGRSTYGRLLEELCEINAYVLLATYAIRRASLTDISDLGSMAKEAEGPDPASHPLAARSPKRL